MSEYLVINIISHSLPCPNIPTLVTKDSVPRPKGIALIPWPPGQLEDGFIRQGNYGHQIVRKTYTFTWLMSLYLVHALTRDNYDGYGSKYFLSS
jgi:hypothetical protein